MKLVALALATLALLATGTASAVAVGSRDGCEGGIAKDPDGCAIWTLKCIGDALSGAACHGETASASAGPDPKKVVACVGYFVQQTLSGNPIEPCAV